MTERHRMIKVDGKKVYYCANDMSLQLSPPAERTISSHKLLNHENINRHERTYISVYATRRCNMACNYCYAKEIVNKGTELDNDMCIESFKQLIDKLCAGDKSYLIHFTGGEPYLNRKLIEGGVEYCAAKAKKENINYKYSVSTNASLITESDVSFIKKHKIIVKAEFDGLEACHNKYRPMIDGSSSYAEVKRALSLLAYNKCSLDVVAVIPASFTAQLEAAYNAIRRYSPSSVLFSALLQETCTDCNAAKYDPKLYERTLWDFARRLIDLRAYDDLMAIRNFRSYLIALHKREPRTIICPAYACRILSVDVDGSLYPCSTLVGRPDFRLGNIFNGVIKQQVRCSMPEQCVSCWAYELCGGICLYDQIHGNDKSAMRIKCGLKKAEIVVALKIYSQLYEYKIGENAL